MNGCIRFIVLYFSLNVYKTILSDTPPSSSSSPPPPPAPSGSSPPSPYFYPFGSGFPYPLPFSPFYFPASAFWPSVSPTAAPVSSLFPKRRPQRPIKLLGGSDSIIYPGGSSAYADSPPIIIHSPSRLSNKQPPFTIFTPLHNLVHTFLRSLMPRSSCDSEEDYAEK